MYFPASRHLPGTAESVEGAFGFGLPLDTFSTLVFLAEL
jgi:hypothetical protein